MELCYLIYISDFQLYKTPQGGNTDYAKTVTCAVLPNYTLAPG